MDSELSRFVARAGLSQRACLTWTFRAVRIQTTATPPQPPVLQGQRVRCSLVCTINWQPDRHHLASVLGIGQSGARPEVEPGSIVGQINPDLPLP